MNKLSNNTFVLLFAGLFVSGCASPKMEQQLLHQCIIRGDSEGAMKIINGGALDGRHSATFGEHLYYAALKNDTNVVRALIAKGADPNWTGWLTPVGQTPVSAAARMRSAEALKILIEHGGSVLERGPDYREYYTPFEVSVLEIEPPGPVTDILIEAGAKPRATSKLPFATAGIHWALASYKERHGDIAGALEHYEQAAKWYEQASREMLSSEKWIKFMNSPFMRYTIVLGALTAPAAAGYVWVDPRAPFIPLDPGFVNAQKRGIARLQDKAERYAAYSKFCGDRAKELTEPRKP